MLPAAGVTRREQRIVLPFARPPRIALGVQGMGPNNWLGAFHRITATWGGVGSTAIFPIAAWQPRSLWDRLLERFDPDVILLGVDNHPNGDLMRRRYAPLMILADLTLVHRRDPLHGEGTVDLIQVAATMPNPKTATPYLSHRLLDGPDALRTMLAATCGYLDDKGVLDLRDAPNAWTIGDSSLSADPSGAGFGETLTWILGGRSDSLASLNGAGIQYLSSVIPITGPAITRAPVIVAGSSFEDICLWLTLRTLRSPASILWYPTDLPAGAVSHTFQLALKTRVSILAHQMAGGHSAVVVSSSLHDQALEDVVQSLRDPVDSFTLQAVADPIAVLRGHHFMALNRHEAAYLEQFTGGESSGFLRPPEIPTWVSKVADVRFLIEASIDKFRPPTHPGIRLLKEKNREHRSGRYGVVIAGVEPFALAGDSLPQLLVRTQLSLPTVQQQLEAIANNEGGKASVSSSGAVLREVVGRFSGIQTAALALGSGRLATIIAELRAKKSADVFIELPESRRAVSEQGLHEHLKIKPGSDEAAELATQLSGWSSRQILYSGLPLKCPLCTAKWLYRWEDFTAAGILCRRCRRHFEATPTNAVRWGLFFGLDEILRHALDNDGFEEIALAALLEKSADTADLALGTDWRFGKLQVETDIAGPVNSNLVIGEAKSVNHFRSNPAQPKRLAQLSDRLQARQLMFATSQPAWDASAIDQMNAVGPLAPGTVIRALVSLRVTTTGPEATEIDLAP